MVIVPRKRQNMKGIILKHSVYNETRPWPGSLNPALIDPRKKADPANAPVPALLFYLLQGRQFRLPSSNPTLYPSLKPAR